VFKIDDDVAKTYPDLHVIAVEIVGVRVSQSNEKVRKLASEVYNRVRMTFKLEELKDYEVFRAYRDFFWELGIDPTKIRPASEALVRRILQGKEIPSVNTLVDAYNLASIETGIALAVFDLDKIVGGIVLRWAKRGEKFRGIGMPSEKELSGNELILADAEKVIAIYPYRDSDETKVTLDTRKVLLIVCGVPGISLEKLNEAERKAVEYIIEVCGGKVVSKVYA